MKFTVLGCSGGIGGKERRTTSFLVDDDVLIDCGTGVGELTLEQLLRIDHVFLTHAHLDHVALLPLLADSVAGWRSRPIHVHASEGTLQALRAHVFNDVMWPDFTVIPAPNNPVLSLHPLEVGDEFVLGRRTVVALPAFHGVPALAYCLDSGDGKLVFSGDTTFAAPFIEAVNAVGDLRHLVIETAFPDEQSELARVSSHLCPQTLHCVLDGIRSSPQVHVCHLKPGSDERILEQIGARAARFAPRRLLRGDVLEF